MKKYIYVVASFAALTFTACDPMEDVYEELDSKISSEYKADIKAELSESDYEFYKDSKTAPAYVASGYYFTSEDEASELIPAILDNKYPQVGEGTKAAIVYNMLTFKFGDNNVKGDVLEYEVTEEDYALGGSKYTSFDKESQVVSFLNAKYPNATEGTLAVLSYTWYNGSADPRYTDVTDSYYFTNGAWVDAYHVADADYVAAGRNRFNNFTSSDDDVLADHFNIFLSNTQVGYKAGDVKYVSYAYYNGKATVQQVMAMTFNGTKWVAVEGDLIVDATLRFQKKSGEWVADRSISYNLVAGDYTWIADQPNISTEGNRTNLKKYGNFNMYSWTAEDVLFGISELLKYKFPDAPVGQKYTVTYDTYPDGLVQVNLIRRESGDYEVPKDGE